MKVRDVFQRYAGAQVALLPNDGNCGDGVIVMGFQRLAAEYHMRFVELLHPRPAEGHALFVLGCGNLGRSYHGQAERIMNYMGKFQRVYVLPCSLDPAAAPVAAMLAKLPPHVTLFCRETYSAELARPLVSPGVEIHLDHDLAFELDYARWAQKGSGRLNAFRTDLESTDAPLPADNQDISFWGGVEDGELMVRTVSGYRVVHTDRAHVAITAAMLGKETHVYPNNYHKLRGIYEYSLRDKPNVIFHDGPPVA